MMTPPDGARVVIYSPGSAFHNMYGWVVSSEHVVSDFGTFDTTWVRFGPDSYEPPAVAFPTSECVQ